MLELGRIISLNLFNFRYLFHYDLLSILQSFTIQLICRWNCPCNQRSAHSRDVCRRQGFLSSRIWTSYKWRFWEFYGIWMKLSIMLQSMPKCDFNKVAKQLYWHHTSAWMFSCKFAAYFQKPFPKNTYGRLLLLRDVFRTLSNIYDGASFAKIFDG